jgi:WD40 repeat protein
LAAVNAIRFNSDGNAFASCSDDKTVRYWKMDKKVFLAGSYFEKEIEKEAVGSPLFLPRKDDETKQNFTTRENAANDFLSKLYDKYYRAYIEMLSKLPVE